MRQKTYAHSQHYNFKVKNVSFTKFTLQGNVAEHVPMSRSSTLKDEFNNKKDIHRD